MFFMSKNQSITELKKDQPDKKQNNRSENVELKFVDAWSNEEIVALYRAGGWWKEHYDTKGIPALIKGSYAFLVAIDKRSGHAVGMGRVISDGVSDAYIQDVVVLPEHRGNGIGIAIVKTLLQHCLKKKLLWIGLVAEPGTKEFYSPFGFNPLAGEPMVFIPEV
jgi:GNAT superfamily N-acetyltransferase